MGINLRLDASGFANPLGHFSFRVHAVMVRQTGLQMAYSCLTDRWQLAGRDGAVRP
jgi:hypothetical protein